MSDNKIEDSSKRAAKSAAPSNYIFQSFPIKNCALYVWRIIAKVLSFVIFGAGSILISILALPILTLLFRRTARFNKAARKLISLTFRFFVGVMTLMGIVRCTIDDKKRIRNLKAGIIVANHPSLLDIVMLISYVPNADAIVNSYLTGKHILSKIVHDLYIPTNISYEEAIRRSVSSLQSGNVLIIFPEGTRSRPEGQNRYKKGAARIALASGCPIFPVYIGGNEKLGLRKHDPMFLFNHHDRYRYNLFMKDAISPRDYKDLPEPAAARRITRKIRECLCDENNAANIIDKNPCNPIFK